MHSLSSPWTSPKDPTLRQSWPLPNAPVTALALSDQCDLAVACQDSSYDLHVLALKTNSAQQRVSLIPRYRAPVATHMEFIQNSLCMSANGFFGIVLDESFIPLEDKESIHFNSHPSSSLAATVSSCRLKIWNIEKTTHTILHNFQEQEQHCQNQVFFYESHQLAVLKSNLRSPHQITLYDTRTSSNPIKKVDFNIISRCLLDGSLNSLTAALLGANTGAPLLAVGASTEGSTYFFNLNNLDLPPQVQTILPENRQTARRYDIKLVSNNHTRLIHSICSTAANRFQRHPRSKIPLSRHRNSFQCSQVNMTHLTPLKKISCGSSKHPPVIALNKTHVLHTTDQAIELREF